MRTSVFTALVPRNLAALWCVATWVMRMQLPICVSQHGHDSVHTNRWRRGVRMNVGHGHRITKVSSDMESLKLWQQENFSSSQLSRKRERDRSAEGNRSRKGRVIEVKDEESSEGVRQYASASLSALALCAICLGEHSNVHKCSSATLWDGQQARCHRNKAGRLVDPRGRTLCLDWQRFGKCGSTSKQHIHECSGCGDHLHGAQGCPLRQKT